MCAVPRLSFRPCPIPLFPGPCARAAALGPCGYGAGEIEFKTLVRSGCGKFGGKERNQGPTPTARMCLHDGRTRRAGVACVRWTDRSENCDGPSFACRGFGEGIGAVQTACVQSKTAGSTGIRVPLDWEEGMGASADSVGASSLKPGRIRQTPSK